MSGSGTATATALLHAFARSDLDAIATLCAPDILLWGTDVGESWEGKKSVVEAFAGAFDLSVRWLEEPTVRDNWVAGHVEFAAGAADATVARVTMVFRDGLLAHAHYSVATAT
jgi:ketosteroid isomerase-like protein